MTLKETEETTENEKEAVEEKLEKEEAEIVKETEEAKLPAREKVEEEEIVEERFYTIPLGKAWVAPRNRRAPRAIRIIRDFIRKHMKLEAGKEKEDEEVEQKKIIISNEVNEKIWSRGIEKPPRKIRVRAVKDKDGNVTVYLAEGD
jgi:large subunit ribosomal protein L31e